MLITPRIALTGVWRSKLGRFLRCRPITAMLEGGLYPAQSVVGSPVRVLPDHGFVVNWATCIYFASTV